MYLKLNLVQRKSFFLPNQPLKNVAHSANYGLYFFSQFLMKETITKSGSIYIQKLVVLGNKTISKTIKKLGNIQDRMAEFNTAREQVLDWIDSQIRELEAQEALSSPIVSVCFS